MVEFKPLENKNMSERVAEHILKMIQSGELKPGDKLPAEPVFASQLGISRGILREGLAQLKSQGVISRNPKYGTFVCEKAKESELVKSALNTMKKASYRNIIDMREAIEQKAVELAIARASDDELEELREMMMTSLEDGDKDVDYYFHYKLVELSRNSIFMYFINAYFDDISEIRKDENLASIERRKEAYKEHMNIVYALIERDVDKAIAAIKTHIYMVGKYLNL